jgi:hypothetical protein
MEKRYSASENHVSSPYLTKVEKNGITIIGFRQAKITSSSPYPAKAPVLKMEKRLSASENHLSAPAPSKAPRAEEDRKKKRSSASGKRKSLFSPYTFQGTTSGRRGKNDFRQTNISFSRVWPFQAPICRYIQQAKITFSNLGPF